MPDGGRFVALNAEQVAKAFKRSPRKVAQVVRREFKRGTTTFRNQTARKLFRGPPGIFVPAQEKVQGLKASQKGKKGKKGKESAGNIRNRAERAHLVAKVHQTKGFHVLYSYLSKFSEFHRKKLQPAFDREFRSHARKTIMRVKRELNRVSQLIVDGKLK